MNEEKTPKWLIETQNKSWEPEILISGIILTFLFIISDYIFNFYGMLVQDYGLRFVVGKYLYAVTIIILTGLKLILVLHLIFRGIWTGFVGLSYVFPHGVNKEKMQESKQHIDYLKPEDYVIRLEKICSLLFSFVFSSFIHIGSFFLVLTPIALLYISGLDIAYIRIIILYVMLPLLFILVVVGLLVASKFKGSALEEKINNSIFSNLLTIYFTNIGLIKTALMFIAYFAVITLLSFDDISKFTFNNEQNTIIQTHDSIVQINSDHYKNLRDHDLRFTKATIGNFWVKDNTLRLSVSFYREDLYTVEKIREKPGRLADIQTVSDSTFAGLPELYQIKIDHQPLGNLQWYGIENESNGQQGIVTTIDLDSVESGYHELRIDKLLWIERKKQLKLIKNWDVIPFELENN